MALFVVILAGVCGVAAVCMWIVVAGASSPDDKKWATATIGTIIGGGVGYLTGKGQRPADP